VNCRRIARLAPVLLCVIAAAGLFAQAPESRGDAAIAEQYAQWAEREMAEGRWAEALAGLERAADFSADSSDLSYLLALARAHENKSRGAVLQALTRAIEAARWVRCRPAQARLLEAEQLAALRNYAGALASLAGAGESADAAALRLSALKGIIESGGTAHPALSEFRVRMAEAMNRYPRDSRPLRVFFDYARSRIAEAEDEALMFAALKRFPLLLETDPDLAWIAAPFMQDTAEARRLVAAYRAGGLGGPAQNGNFRPNAASIAPALHLGLLDDEAAVEELFSVNENSASPVSPNAGLCLDLALIEAAAGLIRSEAGRNRFAEQLLAFSGTITADDDGDGFPESRARYRDGVIREYFRDADQDGLVELVIVFDAGGSPRQAEQALSGESGSGGFRLPVTKEDIPAAVITWEQYPSVLRSAIGETVFIPALASFQFAPIRFAEIAATGTYAGLVYPRREPLPRRLSQRTLAASAVVIQRPGADFAGAVERIDLERGIPRHAEVTLNGQLVSETVFENGWPVIQRLDLDLDSRMETRRHFRPPKQPLEYQFDYLQFLEYAESDWNGDGIFEYAELYREDGSVVYSWDMDGDGTREYSEGHL
jgi:hypothetical protein